MDKINSFTNNLAHAEQEEVITETTVPENNIFGAGSSFFSFLPIIFIMILLYFMVIRPQQRKMKEHQKMLMSLKRGDKVVVNGIISSIVKVDNENRTAIIEIAPEVRIKVRKEGISELLQADSNINTDIDKGYHQSNRDRNKDRDRIKKKKIERKDNRDTNEQTA